MSPADQLELAAFLSMHGSRLVDHHRPPETRLLHRYWIASKARWECWMRVLKRFGVIGAGDIGPDKRRSLQMAWPAVRSVMQQILISEVPTRVWTALMSAVDAARETREAEPIARSVFVAHAEARCRAMRMLLHSPGVPADDAMRLNRLRRQAERWSDVFVGHLAVRYPVAQFAADQNRAADYAEEFRDRPHWQAGEPSWSLLARAWRRGLAASTISGPRADDRGEAVAAAMLECFEPLDHMTTGLSRSLWLMRVQSTATRTHDLIEELCEQEFARSRTALVAHSVPS